VAEPPESVSVGEYDACLTDETGSSLRVDTQKYTSYKRNYCFELGIYKLTSCNIFLAFVNGKPQHIEFRLASAQLRTAEEG